MVWWNIGVVVTIQLLSCVWLLAIPGTVGCWASLPVTISHGFLKLMPTESVVQSNHLILVAPFSSCPQSLPASGSFSNELALPIMWPQYGASASFLLMNSQGWFSSGLTSLISLLSKCLLQYHNSKTSVLWHSAFFMIQFSRLYMSIRKTIM